jgi:hypothetical protein
VLRHIGQRAADRRWARRRGPRARSVCFGSARLVRGALIGARRRRLDEPWNFEYLDIDGVMLEIVPADSKVRNDAAGSVVYWRVADFQAALEHLLAAGATLYRGPIDIDAGQRMAQVRDPWGNCIGIRGLGVADVVGQPHNNRLQRTVMQKVPRHMRQRAAAAPAR